MIPQLLLSEVNSKLSEMMKHHQQITVITDDGEHLMEVYAHDDIESIYATLEILSDPEMMKKLEIGLREEAAGKFGYYDPDEFGEP